MSADITPTPPVISPIKPPPLPAAALAPPVIPGQALRYYRICCGLFVMIYLGLMVSFILVTCGITEPPLGGMTELLTLNNPAARAQALAESRGNAPGSGVVSALGAIFYAFAAFVPRKPWGWIVGLIAIIGMIFPFIVTAALAIPLFIAWLKPGTKRAFSKVN